MCMYSSSFDLFPLHFPDVSSPSVSCILRFFLYPVFHSIPVPPAHSASGSLESVQFFLCRRGSPGDFLPFRRRLFLSRGCSKWTRQKNIAAQESRWRYRREGQISLPVVIAAEKRHLLPNCLLSVPLHGNLHLLQAGQHCCHEQERQNEPDC